METSNNLHLSKENIEGTIAQKKIFQNSKIYKCNKRSHKEKILEKHKILNINHVNNFPYTLKNQSLLDLNIMNAKENKNVDIVDCVKLENNKNENSYNVLCKYSKNFDKDPNLKFHYLLYKNDYKTPFINNSNKVSINKDSRVYYSEEKNISKASGYTFPINPKKIFKTSNNYESRMIDSTKPNNRSHSSFIYLNDWEINIINDHKISKKTYYSSVEKETVGNLNVTFNLNSPQYEPNKFSQLLECSDLKKKLSFMSTANENVLANYQLISNNKYFNSSIKDSNSKRNFYSKRKNIDNILDSEERFYQANHKDKNLHEDHKSKDRKYFRVSEVCFNSPSENSKTKLARKFSFSELGKENNQTPEQEKEIEQYINDFQKKKNFFVNNLSNIFNKFEKNEIKIDTPTSKNIYDPKENIENFSNSLLKKESNHQINNIINCVNLKIISIPKKNVDENLSPSNKKAKKQYQRLERNKENIKNFSNL